jgi:D-apionolactonase
MQTCSRRAGTRAPPVPDPNPTDMPTQVSDSIRLYGTDESVEAPRILQAGPLSAELDTGNLRHIRYHGREMIRAISFIVRDKNWGTYAPQISQLEVQEITDSFRVSYEAVIEGEFRYSAVITGEANGSLSFSGTGNAISDFLTNRTGFVVLHPIEGVAGAACTVEHVDGRVEETRFPLIIDPVQPMRDLRAITHEFSPGLKVTCRMEGDTFEMEDQRNWTDASYKTYVRPLALPWPHTIAKGVAIDQRVTLSVSGSVPNIESKERRSSLIIGKPTSGSFMPPLGIGLHPKDAGTTKENVAVIKEAAPAHIVCYYDPRLGHSHKDLKRMAEIGQEIGVELWLEFVIPNVENFEEDIREAGRGATELGNPFSTVMVSPAPDLKCTLPGSPWPPCPPLEPCYQAARKAFPRARVGGGMFSFFTELNRKRPPLDLLDFVTFTTVAIFHAGDDRSAMEGLESLPYLAKTVRSFIDDKPYHVGPSAIGLRMNPYGEAPMPNPRNIRQAMNGMDPRQRGLFGAAWSVGFVARFVKGGASALTLGGGTGEFGIAYAKQDYAQPWFDENGGIYPAYHAIKGLAQLRGQPLLKLDISTPDELQAIATRRDGGLELWVANLTDQTKSVELTPKLTGKVSILSATDFERSTKDLSAMDSAEREFTGEQLGLPPYAVARIRI